jgi:dipeptidyl aminopeptidase/acylaminoacyl peptidase
MPSFRSMPPAAALLLACSPVWAAAPPTKRPLVLDDLAKVRQVADPQVSPDGAWVAYTVTTVNAAKDKQDTNIWKVSWDGKQEIQLTYSPESESSPRWSPDGKYLSFLSSRPGEDPEKVKGTQVWVMDRRGGEARQLTRFKEKIEDYAWSPDSTRLALVLRNPDQPEADKKKPESEQAPPKPIVVDRYHFKEDHAGYLHGPEHSRIFLYELATQKLNPLTNEKMFDEENPSWSPDGTRIAFVSNRGKDWERTENTDVFVASAKPGSMPLQLTHFAGPDGGRLAWSPDGSTIAYTQGSEPRFSAYNLNRLALVPSRGGTPGVLTGKLDRGVTWPAFTPDGKAIDVLVQDDRSEYPARVTAGGVVERLVGGEFVASSPSRSHGHVALLSSTDNAPAEVFALEAGGLRQLTNQNGPLLAEVQLGRTENISFHSKDGTEVHGIVTQPPAFASGTKYPLLLRIHGGPNGQDGHAFQFERQFFAANGYLVLNVNYRGSAGRGAAYSESIFGDWGNKEVADLLAGVDAVVASGSVDPDRLGIGGWSYGGILTDYTIATDGRFKAAISGAGSANQISMYGVDQYVIQYDLELGPPWKNPERWMKISYPFFNAGRIHTPTLFLGGDLDFNVPLIGGEQMYQALKNLGVPTELVIYPGQHHGISRPSFVRDRLQRYLAWYDKYLKPEGRQTLTAKERASGPKAPPQSGSQPLAP